ncbi:MAG TPA: potassium/proton antiporter, partial [Elusimicrobiota bacterium]|nr:potassium/proton antiporter [Elusimicrobiota bacterium]
VPAILLFLAVGMLSGSEGLGGIAFDNARWAQTAGTVALAFILFAGGLETEWAAVRPVLVRGLSLSTLGVALSAGAMALFARAALGLSWAEGFLLGSIIASTDAAAVFAVLKSASVRLKGSLRPLLEFESGSNDPMAVFLTLAAVSWLSPSGKSPVRLPLDFAIQMGLGLAVGVGGGWGARRLLNAVRLGYEGLYPALTLSLVLVVYGLTDRLGGNGFLAVYTAGLALGNGNFLHKKSLRRFHDGLGWLMQIGMFLTLGLLVFPSRLVSVAGTGLAVSFFLMFVARPISVFLSLSGSAVPTREKWLLSWVGLRGAVPIVMATFPLLAGVPKSDLFFNIVFFVVLTSALVQGTTIPWVARRLGLEAPPEDPRRVPLRLESALGGGARLEDFILPYNSPRVGQRLVALGLPKDSLIALIGRGDQFLVPDGGTVLEAGDVLWVLANESG